MTPLEDPSSVTIPLASMPTPTLTTTSSTHGGGVTARETTDNDSNTSILNTSSVSAANAAENIHNQSHHHPHHHHQDGHQQQKDTTTTTTSSDADVDRKQYQTFDCDFFFKKFSNEFSQIDFSFFDLIPKGEHDYVNINGNSARATIKSEDGDVCDNTKTTTAGNKQKSDTYSNQTRTLTQQSSLVAPSEVHISISPALTAEPVLTLNGNFELDFIFESPCSS